MLHFVFCEDDIRIRENLVEIVRSFIKEENVIGSIELITDKPQDVLDYIDKGEKSTNVYFLDISIQASNDGFTLAKEVRKRDINSFIVFITSFEEFSLKSFQHRLRISDYICKTEKNIKERLENCLREIIENYNDSSLKDVQTIIIKSGSTIYKILLDNIISFETTGIEHKILVSTINNQIEFYGTMKDIEGQLNENFVRIHRSYIINTNHIKKISKSREDMHVIMMDGSKCLLSRNYLKGLIGFVGNSSYNY